MPAVEATPVAASSESDSVKMDDRKRAAAHDHNDSAPPSKKQATSVNGGSKPHPDADMPWKDDLERFQKDAIWRQMQEYKREKISFETKARELSKATTYHNDHLRIIDAWYNQLIDEVKILLDPAKSEEDTKEQPIFRSSLQFEDVETFEKHLKSRSDDIRDVITRLIAISPKAPPAVSDLQSQLAKKLAEEKATITELERAVGDKQQAEESLEAASLRYMVAEKKLDRARSTTAAKLEKQYIFGAQRPGAESDSGTREESTPANGTPSGGERIPELEVAHQRLVAESEKQKEQLQKLEGENASLLNQVTDLNIKHSKHTDDDYAHTDLFKQLRSQYDDVVKRINNFEATNAQLRDEARRLTSERTAYRIQVDEETKNTIAEKEAQLVRAETDLARIRNARDELLADQQMRKAAQEQDKTASVKIQELTSAGEARIASLESEVERLRVQANNAKPTEITEVPIEELRTKHQNLERQYAMLNNELASMQVACKKYSTLASQKVADFSALEEKVARFSAEKSKADQKFFAAMKAKEARDMEVRTLRMQNSKSSDIISQLKDSEAATRSLVANMEKQASEGKEALNSVGIKLQAAHQQLAENGIAMDGLRGQIAELKTLSTSKDSTLANTSSNCRRAETEIEGLKITLSDTKKSLENWKSKSLGNSSSEYEMLRTLALCTVCRRNFKNTAIKTCGHVFCKDCVEERLTSRSRKCPNCNKSFGNNDHMHITL